MPAISRSSPLAIALLLAAFAANCFAQGDYRGGESFRGPPGAYPGGGYPGGGFPGGGFPGGFPGGFRGPPGGFPGGGYPGGSMFSSDPREMVRRADQNGNGMIDPSEMQEGMGRYLQRSAERAGLNVNAPLTIDQVVGAMDQARRE